MLIPSKGSCTIKVVEKLPIYSPSCQQPKLEVFTITTLLSKKIRLRKRVEYTPRDYSFVEGAITSR